MNEEKEIELLPCPCGEIPRKLITYGTDAKWKYVCGNCCHGWSVEFRTNYYKHGTPELINLAIEAWNIAIRGIKHQPCNHVELDEDKVKNYLYAMGDGIYTMDNAKDVAHNICKQFSQPKIKLPSEESILNVIITTNINEPALSTLKDGNPVYISIKDIQIIAKAILQHIKEINGIKE